MLDIAGRLRRHRRYRRMVRELHDYARNELTELGIAPADIDRVARDAAYGQPK